MEMQTAFMNNTSIPFIAESSAGTVKSQAVVYPRESPILTLPTKMEVKDLSIYYNKFRAVEDISIAFPANQITAIIGPSGCGKSTLLRSLNRMTELIPRARVEGSVLLDGEDLYAPGMDVVELRRRIGMVFQRPNPFPMSIYDNIAYGPRLYGVRSRGVLDEIVETSLKQAALWDEVKDKLNHSGMALSGGQQQRLCIARALAVEPDVVLMDEPAASLDPIATLKIEELMQSIKTDYTIVIVTHNMQQAARVSNFTAFMMMNERRAGTLVEFGETTSLFTNPKHKQTEDYVTGRFG
jgi:phosphate transport system ATP-binding protein